MIHRGMSRKESYRMKISIMCIQGGMLNFETEGRDTVIKLHLRIVAKKITIKIKVTQSALSH